MVEPFGPAASASASAPSSTATRVTTAVNSLVTEARA